MPMLFNHILDNGYRIYHINNSTIIFYKKKYDTHKSTDIKTIVFEIDKKLPNWLTRFAKNLLELANNENYNLYSFIKELKAPHIKTLDNDFIKNEKENFIKNSDFLEYFNKEIDFYEKIEGTSK
jgi:hemerythrin superfamily protein